MVLACDPLSIPNDVITPLYHPLICLAIPSFHLARIPRICAVELPPDSPPIFTVLITMTVAVLILIKTALCRSENLSNESNSQYLC